MLPVRLGLSGRSSGKRPRKTLSERFLEFPSRVRLGSPKPYNSRHLRLPEHFQNYLPPSTAEDASFFRIGSGEGLSELPMEFPTVLRGFLKSGKLMNPPCLPHERPFLPLKNSEPQRPAGKEGTSVRKCRAQRMSCLNVGRI